MHFLHVKVAKSDAKRQRKLKALKCWSDENEKKLEVLEQDSSHVCHFKLFRLRSKDTSFFWRLQCQLTTKKKRNIEANDVNLTSMARSTDFCFKTTYVCFCAYDRLYVAFDVLFVVRHPLEKQFPMNPPPPTPRK